MRLPALTLLLLAACSEGASAPDAGLVPFVPPDADHPDVVAPPRVLASGLSSPRGIAWMGPDVVVADSAAGTIVRVPFPTGSTSTLATSIGQPWNVATDGSAVYASERAAGRIVRVDSGGQVTELATGQAKPGRVRVSGGTVYWVDEGASDGAGAVRSVPAAGGVTTDLATGLSTPHDLWIATGWVYVTLSGTTGQLVRLPLASTADAGPDDAGAEAGAPLVVVATPPVPPVGVIGDEGAGFVFYTTRDPAWPNGGNLYRAALDGTGPVPLSYEAPNADAIALTASHVFWSSNITVSRVSRDGGAYDNPAHETSVADFVVASDGTVVWTDPVHGAVEATP